jgi:hypothetical protein
MANHRERSLNVARRHARLSSGVLLLVAAGLVAEAVTACAHQRKDTTPSPPLATPPPPRTAADGRGLTEFANKALAYVALRNKLEASLPKLPAKAEPAAVAAHQKALAEAIRKSGPRPVPGHIFVPDIQPYFKRLLAPELKGPGSAETREKVGEGNPEAAKGLPKDPDVKPRNVSLVPYATYPSDAPVSTVPAPVLLKMPQLPKELEYRFVGKNLILRDTVADVVVDYIPEAVP